MLKRSLYAKQKTTITWNNTLWLHPWNARPRWSLVVPAAAEGHDEPGHRRVCGRSSAHCTRREESGPPGAALGMEQCLWVSGETDIGPRLREFSACNQSATTITSARSADRSLWLFGGPQPRCQSCTSDLVSMVLTISDMDKGGFFNGFSSWNGISRKCNPYCDENRVHHFVTKDLAFSGIAASFKTPSLTFYGMARYDIPCCSWHFLQIPGLVGGTVHFWIWL